MENKYAFYCKETKQSFGPFVAVSRGSFESKCRSKKESSKLAYDMDLCRAYRMNFALVDVNGAVLMVDLKIAGLTLGDRQFSLRVYEDLSRFVST